MFKRLIKIVNSLLVAIIIFSNATKDVYAQDNKSYNDLIDGLENGTLTSQEQTDLSRLLKDSDDKLQTLREIISSPARLERGNQATGGETSDIVVFVSIFTILLVWTVLLMVIMFLWKKIDIPTKDAP